MSDKTATKNEVKMTRRSIESYDIAKVDETFALANDLARFIKENKLFQNIQGREYVNVEGWQYAGARLGIMPIVDELISLGDASEVKYQSKVSLLNLRDGQIVGGGFAVCSNKEQGKKFFQEYAIASMAQTRAIGKAYRNLLAWIIRAAGYEPTPAEEMEHAADVLESKMDTYLSSHGMRVKQGKGEVTTAPVSDAPAQEEEPKIKMATVKQKEQLIKLLNSPYITADEKNKMLLNVNSFDEERAKQAIARLKKTIEDRESGVSAAA
jgi:hypothetical protein